MCEGKISSFFFSQQEIIIPADLPLVQELGATLREWAQIWQKLYVVRVDVDMLIGALGLLHTCWFGWTQRVRDL